MRWVWRERINAYSAMTLTRPANPFQRMTIVEIQPSAWLLSAPLEKAAILY